MVLYTQDVDENKEGVLKTARGLVLGDTREKAIELYGEGTPFEVTEDTFSSLTIPEEYQEYVQKIWQTGLQYQSDDGLIIKIVFDDADCVSGVFFDKER